MRSHIFHILPFASRIGCLIFDKAVSWLKSQEVLRDRYGCHGSDSEGSELRIWNRKNEFNEVNHIYDEDCV